jgi:hypothetical protein
MVPSGEITRMRASVASRRRTSPLSVTSIAAGPVSAADAVVMSVVTSSMTVTAGPDAEGGEHAKLHQVANAGPTVLI